MILKWEGKLGQVVSGLKKVGAGNPLLWSFDYALHLTSMSSKIIATTSHSA